MERQQSELRTLSLMLSLQPFPLPLADMEVGAVRGDIGVTVGVSSQSCQEGSTLLISRSAWWLAGFIVLGAVCYEQGGESDWNGLVVYDRVLR